MFDNDTKLYTIISYEFSAARLQSCLDYIPTQLVFPLAIETVTNKMYSAPP